MISLIILGIIFLYAIISYNTLTRKRNNVDNAFGSIDVMLKKRFDLIPNLVATVQQYAKHEEETFAKITNLRTKSYDSLTAEEKTESGSEPSEKIWKSKAGDRHERSVFLQK